MKTLVRCCLLALTFSLLLSPLAVSAQDGKPPLSPPATAETKLGDSELTIKYSTPSMRGRKIFGDLVPYDHWWRTGANPATTFITATNLKIGTLDVPAGTYTIYTIPEPVGTPWKLIINKQNGQWGTEYHEDQDLGRTSMMFKKLATPQEAMSISFENVHGKTAELHVRWETSDAWVKVEAK